ncbi:DNA-binding ferritin-like protein (Dps family) [Auraticoccus monumenti]|uniref:DNA-binding ferritin-like protein (Dps family) n=2 Tax=Auraticoccus monumenti TaxID=675864 RepID=A0A1G6VGY8_9ACTN|nr:DNA-binding ferritin-like protein (Dps family) [Auraticoccus monumenti]
MVAGWIEHVTGSFEDKKRWRRYKARKEELPPSYRTAIDGIERYLMYRGAISKGDVLMTMCEDLADLVEQAAADQTPVRDVVGEDPVEFAETFIANYADGQWIDKERRRLTDAIDQAAEQEHGRGGPA